MDSWIWGLSLSTLAVAIHATGVTFMALVLHGIRIRLGDQPLSLPRVFALIIGAITVVGLLLAALHGIEAAVWGAAYCWLGAIASPKIAVLYSLDSMATRGATGVMIQPHWQIMGALEAANGMLLFGISTAFIFTVLQFYYQHLIFRARPGGSSDAA